MTKLHLQLANLLVLLFAYSILNAQALPIDFEGAVTTSNFEDFDGGTAEVVANPQPNGINTSASVAKIVRNGGALWAGSKILLADNLDFSTLNTLSLKMYTTAPAGTTMKFKLEGAGPAVERDVQTTVSGEWETLTWDFTGTANDLNYLVFMFDFGNEGDGSETSTFYFDDVEQLFGGFQIDWPVDFEASDVNYTTTPFEGNSSALVLDPEDATNHVIQSIKLNGSSPSAGTTIGTSAGFATYLPLTLTDSKMTVKVWSPTAGTPVRLKVEDSNDPTHTCETQVNTTIGGAWETLEFDFSTEAPGTAALSFGLDNGWAYNMASIFFNFGTAGGPDEPAYYFDNVRFGDLSTSTTELSLAPLTAYPNPTSQSWTISSEKAVIHSISLFNNQGQLIRRQSTNNLSIEVDATDLVSGIYFVEVNSDVGVQWVKLMRK